jgi:hypothetical protein
VTWPVFGEAGKERPAGRYINYAQARKLPGSRLSFKRFSSLPHMRDRLPTLLHTGTQEPGALQLEPERAKENHET